MCVQELRDSFRQQPPEPESFYRGEAAVCLHGQEPGMEWPVKANSLCWGERRGRMLGRK